MKRWLFRIKTRRLVFKRFNLILKTVRKTLRWYRVERLPLQTFNLIVNNSYFTDEQIKEMEGLKHFCLAFNKTLDMIKKFAADNGAHFGDGCVSYYEVRKWIRGAKDGFITGQQMKHEGDTARNTGVVKGEDQKQ